ncbi:MAG: hypothetical protein PHW34_05710 [Hespellia sp.]|nr:hypothetical protein [Hespellia sp.]
MEVTDTGVPLTSLAKIVYVKLDKCVAQVKAGMIPEGMEQLCNLLIFIADVNSENVKEIAKSNPNYSAIQLELANMVRDREEMLMKYHID